MAAKIEITDIYGNILPNIAFSVRPGTTDIGTVRLDNVGDAEAVDVLLSTCNTDWSFTGQTNRNGQEIVTRQFVEAYHESAWAPIGGAFATPGNYITIASIPAGDSVDIPLRMVIPTDAATKGQANFVLVGSL